MFSGIFFPVKHFKILIIIAQTILLKSVIVKQEHIFIPHNLFHFLHGCIKAGKYDASHFFYILFSSRSNLLYLYLALL